ncbi:5-carboxymethyl-2-hydroxymuconate isomerase [uncultured Tateyamaria sp.]|uniref:5-carboxymethyl-2-hydroxymuconate isomerase n=1 Tax=Tateyamaria sp. 1078 TaxID=3417464 RepID=UPI002622063D|nr:5-carboxymethyl-2-hydroxymuconate isomerase [uncultured Tateyamaria sp.]
MPHITLEYSANLEEHIDIAALCGVLRDSAVATGIFPPAGIRVRAFAATHVVIADGDPRHGFIDIAVRIGAGRDGATQSRAADEIFDAAQRFTAEHMAVAPFLLSFELREAATETSRKSSSIRRFLPTDMH